MRARLPEEVIWYWFKSFKGKAASLILKLNPSFKKAVWETVYQCSNFKRGEKHLSFSHTAPGHLLFFQQYGTLVVGRGSFVRAAVLYGTFLISHNRIQPNKSHIEGGFVYNNDWAVKTQRESDGSKFNIQKAFPRWRSSWISGLQALTV